MKTKTYATIGFALCLAACGSSGESTSKLPCDDVCEKTTTCDQEAVLADCMEQCATMKEIMRAEVVDAMGACMLDLPCNSDQMEACTEAALAKAPANAADPFIRATCEATVACAAGQITLNECIDLMKQQAGEAMAYFGVFKDSVIDCLSDCVKGLTCEELKDESAMEGCVVECGVDIDFGESGEGGGTP